LFLTLLVFKNLNAQTKFLNLENKWLGFSIDISEIHPGQLQDMVDVLKVNFLNSDFEISPAGQLTFKRELTDHTRLNFVQAAIQEQIQQFGAKVEFSELDNISELLHVRSTRVFTFYINHVNTYEQANALEAFMLNESRFFLVNVNHINHKVHIVTDHTIDYDLLKDILASQGKQIISADEFSKYY
jgi:hypothetical protein